MKCPYCNAEITDITNDVYIKDVSTYGFLKDETTGNPIARQDKAECAGYEVMCNNCYEELDEEEFEREFGTIQWD